MQASYHPDQRFLGPSTGHKDKAVVGVEAARGESLLDRLARQLGRASNLANIVVIIGSRRLPRKSSGS